MSKFLYADGRRALAAMTRTYWQLLEEIHRSPSHLLHRRIRIRPRKKLAIALSAVVGATLRGAEYTLSKSPQQVPTAK